LEESKISQKNIFHHLLHHHHHHKKNIIDENNNKIKIMKEPVQNGKTFTFESVLNCSAKDFVMDKDTQEFREFHMTRVGTQSAETLRTGIEEVDVNKKGMTEKRFVTVVRTVPGIKLPMVVKPLLKGGHVEFVDTRSTTPTAFEDLMNGRTETHETIFRTVNNITKHAVVDGVISIIPMTKTTCKVVVHGLCHVTLGSLGRLIENIIVNGIGKSYEQLPEIYDGWIAYKRVKVLSEKQPVAAVKADSKYTKTEKKKQKEVINLYIEDDETKDDDSETSYATASTEFDGNQNSLIDIESFSAPLTPIFNSILSFGFGSSKYDDDDDDDGKELDGDFVEEKEEEEEEEEVKKEKDIDFNVEKVVEVKKKSSTGFACCFAAPAVEV